MASFISVSRGNQFPQNALLSIKENGASCTKIKKLKISQLQPVSVKYHIIFRYTIIVTRYSKTRTHADKYNGIYYLCFNK